VTGIPVETLERIKELAAEHGVKPTNAGAIRWACVQWARMNTLPRITPKTG